MIVAFALSILACMVILNHAENKQKLLTRKPREGQKRSSK